MFLNKFLKKSRKSDQAVDSEHEELLKKIEKFGSDIDAHDDNLVEEQIKFSRECYEIEAKRASTVEQKASQILGQTSIVITLSMIGVPSIIGVFREANGSESIWILVVEILAALLILFSSYKLIYAIVAASKAITPRAMFYPVYKAIIDGDHKTVKEFKLSLISSYMKTIQINRPLVAIKVQYVFLAHNNFRNALIYVSLGLFILYVGLGLKSTIFKTEKESLLTNREKEYVFRAFEKYLSEKNHFVYLDINSTDSIVQKETSR